MSTDNLNHKDWPIIIAEAIERNLEHHYQGRTKEIDFVSDMARRDARLYDPKNVTDRSLSAAWNFADSFFDAAAEGVQDLDGIPWETATRLMSEIAANLRDGTPISNPLVLRYA